jgi:hypothetical protein
MPPRLSIALGVAIGRVGQFLDGYGQGIEHAAVGSPVCEPADGVARLRRCAPSVRSTTDWSRWHCSWRSRGAAALAGLTFLRPAATTLAGPAATRPAFLFGLQIDQMLAGALVLALAASVHRFKMKTVWRTGAHEADPVLEA